MQEVYVLNVGKLPDRRLHPLKRRRCELALQHTPGVLDWCETEKNGTLLFFGTRTHAEKAMEAMKLSRNPVAEHIFVAEMDLEKKCYMMKGILKD